MKSLFLLITSRDSIDRISKLPKIVRSCDWPERCLRKRTGRPKDNHSNARKQTTECHESHTPALDAYPALHWLLRKPFARSYLSLIQHHVIPPKQCPNNKTQLHDGHILTYTSPWSMGKGIERHLLSAAFRRLLHGQDEQARTSIYASITHIHHTIPTRHRLRCKTKTCESAWKSCSDTVHRPAFGPEHTSCRMGAQ